MVKFSESGVSGRVGAALVHTHISICNIRLGSLLIILFDAC